MAATAVCLLLRGGIAVAVRSNNVWADKLHAARYEWVGRGSTTRSSPIGVAGCCWKYGRLLISVLH
jgi:hypothetical protein